MKKEHKDFIAKEVRFLSEKESQNKIAKIAQVSGATISQILNDNWTLIKDEMWFKIKANLNINWDWIVAPTSNYLLIHDILKKAQKYNMSVCISDKQGLGKTETYKSYQRENKNVILIECKNLWKVKSFAKNQLIACGLEIGGTTEEMVGRFIDYLKKKENALIIYDQFDKLKDSQKDLFMDFYNEVGDNVAFVLSGVSLEKQEKRGINLNKMGYRERFSRYGSRFIKLNSITLKDVKSICEANGVTDKEVIAEIFEDSSGDLRRVKRSVNKYFIEQSEKNVA